MIDLVQVTPPVGEPVSLDDVLRDLGYGDSGSMDPSAVVAIGNRITPLITAARRSCEAYQRRAYLTQTWHMNLDGFPGISTRYERYGYPEIKLPYPPFQRIVSFQYVDVGGTLQPLTQDTTYGTNPTSQYGYQLDPGGESQPARVLPPFARPWPPTRLVAANVQIQFVAGYGGPVMVSVAASSTSLAGATFLASDVGRPISIPGAGATEADTLYTTIASVVSGNATIANAAGTTVSNATAYLGNPVPGEILMAIRFLTRFFYEQGGAANAEPPQHIRNLLGESRNLVA